ncbi:unnamed protein product, partial [Oppiella nova]
VECTAGYDGGLNQTFHLDIFDDSERKRLLTQLTNKLKPIFAVQGLESGHIFHLSVYSANSKGKSVAKTITSNTLTLSSLSSDAKQESVPFLMDLNPLFGAVVGLLTASILVTVIIVLICKINRRNRNRDQRKDSANRSKCNSNSVKDKGLHEFPDTKSPDIIPPSIEFTGDLCPFIHLLLFMV